MAQDFEIQSPQRASDYFRRFHPESQKKGEVYYLEDHILQIDCLEPRTRFLAEFDGPQLFSVELTYRQETGWNAICSCPTTFHCKHAYAAMRTLLEGPPPPQVEQAPVDSAKKPAGTGPKPPRTNAADALPPGKLSETLAAKLGRPLDRGERRFLRQFHELWLRHAQGQMVSRWELDRVGLPMGDLGWQPLEPWPAPAQDEVEFWLYIAHELEEKGKSIPAFLVPITDLTDIRRRFAEARRQQEIERWRSQFTHWADQDPTEAVSSSGGPLLEGRFDLRLRFRKNSAVLEWQRPGEVKFTPLKAPQARILADSIDAGTAEIPAELEPLWMQFRNRLVLYRNLELNYSDLQDRRLLSRLLRLPELRTRATNAAGAPYQYSTAPLRWQLSPDPDANENYALQLVDSEGVPAGTLACVLPGSPPLCVTANTICPGPPLKPSALDAQEPNRIPAAALESPEGVAFLHRLQVEPPESIRNRIRTLPVGVTIRCRLYHPHDDEGAEECQFQIQAKSKDGMVNEDWNGFTWEETGRGQRRGSRSEPSDSIVSYDRSLLDRIPRLLAPLALRPSYANGTLALRVTKKFPETFVPWLKSIPPEITVKLDGQLASLAREAVAAKVRLEVAETAVDWFDLRVALDVADTTLTPEELNLLLKAQGGFVRLGAKGWRRLEYHPSEEDDERLARLGLNPRQLSAEPQRLHALQLADDAARRFLPPAQADQIQRRAAELKARVTPDVPSGITAQLRPYQVDGYHFLAYLATNHFGGILADDMGLGKTLQALAWIEWLRAQPPAAASNPPEPPAARPTLVVCPKSVMDNWRGEAERFAKMLRVRIWHPADLREGFRDVDQADLHVLNYTQLRLVGTDLAAIRWFAVILDEGQYIKNPDSQAAQAARSLPAEHRLILSGTPIENRLLDLWSLMSFAMPGVLGNRTQFQRLYSAKDDPFARRRLAARVRPFLLRRTKDQVAKDLPERVEEDLFCELEGEQLTLYRAELKRARQLLLKVQTQKELAEQRFHFLTSLLRLRQICCHPGLVGATTANGGAKLDALLDLLEPLMEEGHKVLVFSQFVELIDRLKPEFQQRQWRQFCLTGDTENRGELVQSFQAHEGSAVFLLSLKAGGFGLNLTAASYVVLFDPWWNPAVERQAIDRTHRIGQTEKVIAYRLLIKNSIEEKIRQLQIQKAALAEDILGEERFAAALTLDDLRYLLEDS